MRSASQPLRKPNPIRCRTNLQKRGLAQRKNSPILVGLFEFLGRVAENLLNFPAPRADTVDMKRTNGIVRAGGSKSVPAPLPPTLPEFTEAWCQQAVCGCSPALRFFLTQVLADLLMVVDNDLRRRRAHVLKNSPQISRLRLLLSVLRNRDVQAE